ncbi:MAG: septum formation initiator family protein [Desulfobacteraceae bacterium]|nr:MAG: septum formation initiator family protein [Desulfobacteraceae bacterium]
MSPKKRRLWKFALVFLCFFGPLLAWLGFGNHGLVQLYRKEMERQAYVDTIRQLAEENQAMLEEIRRLRTDMKYVESVARKEFNFVKQNEIVYRFDNDNTRSNAVKTIQPETKPIEDKRSKREVLGDEKIK